MRRVGGRGRRRGGAGSGRSALVAIGGLALAGGLVASRGRRDVADLAVGVQPFEQLRGMDFAAMRSGGVRALRRAAEPAPLEGLREPVGAFDVVYAVSGYDGTDGSWPSEDAMILAIEATRAWPSDTSARAAWRSARDEIAGGIGRAAQCADVSGPGFTVRVAEFTREDGYSVSVTFDPGVAGDPVQTARHAIAVRRQALTAVYPEAGAPNPEGRATWVRVACDEDAA